MQTQRILHNSETNSYSKHQAVKIKLLKTEDALIEKCFEQCLLKLTLLVHLYLETNYYKLLNPHLNFKRLPLYIPGRGSQYNHEINHEID